MTTLYSWLHHCNVDRIFALWQATYPDAYISSQGVQDPYGTYTIAPGSTDYSSTILTPFTSTAAGDFWNSDTTRSLSAWGYTYPEINDWNQTKADLAASVTKQVNALYGSQSGANSKKHARDIYPTKTQEWFVDIAVSKFELGSSFSVLIFLGDAPTDSSTWTTATNLAGSLFISTPPYQRKGAKLTTHGEIALKQALETAHLSDTSEAGVIDYLTKNLQWRVQKTDGTVVDTSTCLSLKINAKVEDVTYPTSEYGFPSYGNPVEHPEVTEGKAGGK
jgi:tyrosinase